MGGNGSDAVEEFERTAERMTEEAERLKQATAAQDNVEIARENLREAKEKFDRLTEDLLEDLRDRGQKAKERIGRFLEPIDGYIEGARESPTGRAVLKYGPYAAGAAIGAYGLNQLLKADEDSTSSTRRKIWGGISLVAGATIIGISAYSDYTSNRPTIPE